MSDGYTRVVSADQFEAFVRPIAEELYRAAFNAGLERAAELAEHGTQERILELGPNLGEIFFLDPNPDLARAIRLLQKEKTKPDQTVASAHNLTLKKEDNG